MNGIEKQSFSCACKVKYSNFQFVRNGRPSDKNFVFPLLSSLDSIAFILASIWISSGFWPLISTRATLAQKLKYDKCYSGWPIEQFGIGFEPVFHEGRKYACAPALLLVKMSE